MPAAMMANAGVQASVLDRIIELGGEADDSTLIGLHGEHSTHAEILPLLRVVGQGRRVIAPRSARWSGFEGGGRFSWFSSMSPPLIEPIGFGDSLIQLERLAFEYAASDRPRGTVILGVGQGATMGLALGALWPELFAGVIAIGGTWPVVPGWTLPDSDMSDVRVLLAAGTDLARSTLAERGARLGEVQAGDIDATLAGAVRQWIAGEPNTRSGRG